MNAVWPAISLMVSVSAGWCAPAPEVFLPHLPPNAKVSVVDHSYPAVFARARVSLSSSTQWIVLYDQDTQADGSYPVYVHGVTVVEKSGTGFRPLATRQIDLSPYQYWSCCKKPTGVYEMSGPGRVTAIAIVNLMSGRYAVLDILGWDGNRLRRLFRAPHHRPVYEILPSSGSASLVIEASGGSDDPPDVYVVRSSGVTFANADYPAIYASYVSRAKRFQSRKERPASSQEWLGCVRALIYAGKYDLCLEMTQKALDRVPSLEDAEMGSHIDLTPQMGSQSLHLVRG